MSDAGIPEGWEGQEAEPLRFGVWRFYRIVDTERSSSVSEDNMAVRDGVPEMGDEGLKAYLADLDPLADPDRLPPPIVAAQVGYFLIRGDSRQSAFVRVAEDPPPSSSVEGGRWRFRATYQRDGYRQPVELELDSNGDLVVHRGEIVPSA
jgi:hypothetical protein